MTPPQLLYRLLLLLLPHLSHPLRCFTDVSASKGKSTNCGEGTGCIKVYIDSEVHLMQLHDRLQRRGHLLEPGKLPELPERLRGDPVLMRGCFTLMVSQGLYINMYNFLILNNFSCAGA